MPNSPRHLAKAPDVFHHLEPSRPDINFNNPCGSPGHHVPEKWWENPHPKWSSITSTFQTPTKKDNTELYNTALKATGTQLEYRQKILAYPNHHLVMIKWQCVSKTGFKQEIQLSVVACPLPFHRGRWCIRADVASWCFVISVLTWPSTGSSRLMGSFVRAFIRSGCASVLNTHSSSGMTVDGEKRR